METAPDDDRSEVCFTPEQLAIRAFVDSLDEVMPWVHERNNEGETL